MTLTLQGPPVQTPFLDTAKTYPAFPWMKWFQTVQQAVNANDFSGSGDLGAQINAAIANGIRNLQIPDGDYTVTTPIIINKPAFIQLGIGTITFQMPDQGTAKGAITISSDDVTIEGRGAGTVFTQPNGQNIQTAIFLGAHQNISFRKFKGDWNDVNLTNASGFYDFLRSSAGSADLMVYDCQFTRCGDRAIDFRGANRVWIVDNYFFKTGLFTLQLPSAGNSISVDVDGLVQSTDVWLVHNLVEEHGDSFAAAHALRVHIMGNTIRGAADFGNTPTPFESGIDATGNVDCEIIGNHLINVAGAQLSISNFPVGPTSYISRNQVVKGNTFTANTSAGGLPATDPRLTFATESAVGQAENIIINGNAFDGVRVSIESVKGFSINDNIFNDVLSSLASGVAISIDQDAVGGRGITADFSIQDNLFLSDNGSLTTTCFVNSRVTTPGQVIYNGNLQDSSVPNGFTSATPIPSANLIVDKILAEGPGLAVANVSISAGWGTGASVTAVEGNDTACRIVVTAGTSPSAFPTITVTYKQPFGIGPIPLCCRADTGSTPASGFSIEASTNSQLTLAFLDTPVAASLYAVHFHNIALG
jgi:hypothetical protein